MFKAPRTKNTADFYDRLIDGSVSRSLWGSASRFSPQKIAASRSTQVHYEPSIKALCQADNRALDIGCSTGGFTRVMAKYCADVTGVDLSAKAVGIANKFFGEEGLTNCRALVGNGSSMEFESSSFDIIQLIDVIHHAEDPSTLMQEVLRLLKDGGRVVIFEPNKYNVLLGLMCLLDKNEWGALRFGSMRSYRNLIGSNFLIEDMEYCGLLIGPSSALALKMANYFTEAPYLLATQSPKIKITLQKVPI